jgi:Protein of unknown function (DUF2283)
MSKLVDAFPILASELAQSLREAGREALAEQIERATITRVTFDNSANAGYVYLEPSRTLNAVETNIVGVRHGETVQVKTQFWTNLDTDNFDRLTGIEILDPRALKTELRRRANS